MVGLRFCGFAAIALLACSAERRAPEPQIALEPSPARALPEAKSVPGPGPQTRAPRYDAAAENEACERCHTAIAAEWRASSHRSAWDDEVFLAAFALEPTAFCRRCHAPEVDEQREDADPNRHLGVGCVTCHVVSHEILGAHDRAAVSNGHAVTGEPRLTSAAWCGGCHQFAFPEPQDAAMQSTLAEHQSSPLRDQSCQDCHMREVTEGASSHRSHTFRVQGDVALLRSSISTEARRSGPRSIVVSLRVTGAAHAVPTGDLYRRLLVRAEAGGIWAKPAVLARSFVRREGAAGPRRVQVADTRLAASGDPSEVELFFPQRIEGAPVRFEVVYQRMGPHEAMLFGVDLSRDETLLASGELLVESPPPGASR